MKSESRRKPKGHDSTEKFQLAQSYALRVAVFTALFAVPPMLIPEIKDWTQSRGISIISMVSTFLFTVDRTVGGTLAGTTVTFLGSILAAMYMWILQGFYPGGVGADETGQAYAVGITALVVWVLVFMALNVPGGIRFGALAGFMGFSMAFLNPQTKLDTYSHGFQINLKTAEFNAIGNALLGSVLALICACLPVPMSALAKAK